MTDRATDRPRLSIVILNYGRADFVQRCMDSLDPARARLDGRVEVLIVDNGSGEECVAALQAAHPADQIIALPANLPLSQALNAGWRRASADWIVLLNNDVTVREDALAAMLDAIAERDDVGSVSAQMRFGDRPDVINSAGIAVDRLGVPFDRLIGAPVGADASAPVEVFGTCGGAGMYRRAALEQLDGFDESLQFGFEDVDFAWRAQMHGWRALHVPAAVVHHRHGGTVGHGSPYRYYHGGRNRVRMLAMHLDGRHLRRYGPAIVAYDLAYVAYVAVTDRTLAPLRGRIHGLMEWRTYRGRGAADRRHVELAAVEGVRRALRRRSAWIRA